MGIGARPPGWKGAGSPGVVVRADRSSGLLQRRTRRVEILVYGEGRNRGGSMPDKSPRKPSSKKAPDRSLKEKRQDKKDKKAVNKPFGG